MPDNFPYDVFLSHSSKDKAIVRDIAQRLRADGLSVWFDESQIRAGDSIPAKVEEGLEQSRVLVLCMSANAFGSDWAQLEAGTFRFRDPLNRERRFIPLRLDDAPIKGSLAQFLYINWLPDKREQAYAKLLEACRPGSKPLVAALTQDRISIARLPTSGRELFGRDAELQLLDEAWTNPNTNIITFVAWGGVGKTALVNHWLKQRMARENYRSAERIYGWSFFSQGTSERAASADLFIDQALRWFGDQDPTTGSPWDKGERLAGYIRQSRTLLILDGLEPLQYPPGPQEGRLKDAALQALLVELAAQQTGLCIISTRERVGDLVEFEASTVVQHELEYLSPPAGAQILRSLNVKGHEEELEEASREFDGHAFSLTLLGSYLDEVLDSDIRRRQEIENLFDDARHGEAAQKMIAAYERWLGEAIELAILRILGFFERPADIETIVALREAPAIPGLTEPLQDFKGRQWSQAVAKLRRLKLLGEASAQPGTLEAHPLLREYFKQQLKRERPDAWREGNYRLYEHLKNTTKEFPETVGEMSPLYAAVAHGSAAARHEQAFVEVYSARIHRGDQYFNLRRLGAWTADLQMLSGFFSSLWGEPLQGLDERISGFVLHQAGVDLRALGRLQEASEPMQAALDRMITAQNWKSACTCAINLSELRLIAGELQTATAFARQSVQMSDQQPPARSRADSRSALADALHQAGRIQEAAAAFAEAEAMQFEVQVDHPFLYSVRGFRYCELLLSLEEIQNVKDRASQAIEIARRMNFVLDLALNSLVLGRAYLVEAQQGTQTAAQQALELLQQAVDGLQRAGTIHHLPRGLLARAEFHRFNQSYESAKHDLGKVFRIAVRSGMGLYLADYHLESARLHLAQGNEEKAHEHWTTAKGMIENMGYHRRDKEAEEIAAQLN